MKLTATALPDVLIVEAPLFGDDRGWFMESFNQPRWQTARAELGLPPTRPFVQDNHSRSAIGVLRGLHFQRAPRAQGKLLRVVKGAAFDVALDIRRGSPSFGRWVGQLLSADNRLQLWIPEGFAHGFLALEDDTHVLYKTTDTYAREAEGAIAWNDPALAIEWPLSPGFSQPLLAPKDVAAPPLAQADIG